MSVGVLLSMLALSSLDGGATALPVVTVPLIDDTPPPTAPSRRDATATVTTIDANAHRTEVANAAELVAFSPGTSMLDSGGIGQRKTMSLRGAAPNAIGVLLDGISLAGPGAAVDFSRIPLAAIDSVEVLRGGSSGRYGLGNMGGIVNLVTRKPNGTRVFGSLQGGSFFTAQANVGASAPVLKGDALVIAHGLFSKGNFFFDYDSTPTTHDDAPVKQERLNNIARQGGAFLKYRTQFGSNQVDAFAEGFIDSRGLAGTVQNPTADASQRTVRGMGSLRGSHVFENTGQLTLTASVRADHTILKGSPFGVVPYLQTEGSAALEAVYSQLLADTHGLTALASVAGDWLTEPTAKNPAWFRGALMLADDWLLFKGAATVSGSVRIDSAGPFFVFSPKLGVSVALPAGLEVRANAGQSARAPSFQELYVMQGTLIPNSALQPERALTGDLSLSFKREKYGATATGFYSLYENLISYEYYPPTLARPYNFAAASAAGLELEASARPRDWFEATASYTFLQTANLRDDARYYLKSLPFRPAHRVNARVVAGPTWLKFRGDLIFQSAQFQNRTATLELPARAFVNLGASVKPSATSPFTIAAEVKNLLDVQTQDIDGYPLPPRAAYVSLSFDLDVKAPVHP